MKNGRKKNEFAMDKNNMDNTVISYVAYTLSAYAMVITITGMAEFRTEASLYQGLLINLLSITCYWQSCVFPCFIM